MNTCRNPEHPHCTYWVAPGRHVCEAGHGQPAATPEVDAAQPGQATGQSSYELLASMRNARVPGPAAVQEAAPVANYATPIRVRPQLHISGFDPRAAGGRQTLKIELRGMPEQCAPQLAIKLSSELIPNGASRQQFVRSVDGDWRPVFVEFSSRDREHGQYQIHTEVLSQVPGQPARKWECTFVILVPRLDATLTEIHRIFLSTHKNVRVMADDASIARVADRSGHGGGSMDIDVTARNAGIAHLDLGAPQGKVDLGFSTIAWDEDLIEIDMPHTGPAHPHPSRSASFVNAAPEAGAQRHIRLFALDECVFGRMEIVDPEAHALLSHYGPDGIDAAGLTRRLSGRHAVIRRGAHGFEIEDVSRYGLLLDGVWPGKHKPVALRLGMKIELSANIKGIVVLEVTALMPHGVILHRIDDGARAECFVVLAPDTHPGYPLRRMQAAPIAAALPLLFHHNGGFWQLDAVTGKETALGPQAQLDKLARIPQHTRFASEAYPESWIIRTSGVEHRTVAEMQTA
ncbi:FHA domain-containing protein [Pseudoduganella flava]|uniref:FHA domain-containing protein n=1 Tax=Pseudoduganella flava TaxID=871742 RepID=A0A562PH04_9BURK|nr:FHA domain-containing protein [Pseudoduganella flava]QGZ42572.1 FHA domain-containing protein [Pseudoduganella flava]TWI43724.1 FHA domain-containing protein [Pseudoduganella flava]